MARCRCGKVEVELAGKPIVCAVCYCDDCQEGGRKLAALPGAAPVLDVDGGSNYVLYRKDRVQVRRGAEHLQPLKLLRPDSITNRVVAGCCNTALFLSFDKHIHWVTVFRARVEGDLPALEMRTNTKYLADPRAVPHDAPAYKTVPPRFIGRLLAARIAMLFG